MLTGYALLNYDTNCCDVCSRHFITPAYLSLMPKRAGERATCGPCRDWADRNGTLRVQREGKNR